MEQVTGPSIAEDRMPKRDRATVRLSLRLITIAALAIGVFAAGRGVSEFHYELPFLRSVLFSTRPLSDVDIALAIATPIKLLASMIPAILGLFLVRRSVRIEEILCDRRRA